MAMSHMLDRKFRYVAGLATVRFRVCISRTTLYHKVKDVAHRTTSLVHVPAPLDRLDRRCVSLLMALEEPFLVAISYSA